MNANSTTFILRRGSDNNFWNGSAWQVAVFNLATTHIATSGNTNATWTSNVTFPVWSTQVETNYVVQSTATDRAGNTVNAGAVIFSLDRTAPSVTINQAIGQADPTNTAPVNFTAVFSEAINSGTFTPTDVTITGTAGGTKVVAITNPSADSKTFNIAVSGMTTAGTVIATIPAGGVSDAAANTNAASTSTDNTITWSGTPTQLLFTISPSSSTTTAFGSQPVVEVKDAAGNTVSTDTSSVTLSITPGTPSAGGPGALYGTVTVAAVNGIATFSGLSIKNVGTGYRLRAIDGALAPANSATFDIGTRAITVSAVANTKTYEGDTTAASIPTITSGSLAPGDTGNFTEAYGDRNAGSGKTLTPSGSVSDGNSGNNYTIGFVPVVTGVIDTRAITVTAATDTKPYRCHDDLHGHTDRHGWFDR